MRFSKALGVVLILAGACLLYFGIEASGAFYETAIKKVAGHYSDKTMGFIIGGIIACAIGVGLVFSRKKPK